MSAHISRRGIEIDDEGYYFVTCDCGQVIGPYPDHEMTLDAAMEHAYSMAADND